MPGVSKEMPHPSAARPRELSPSAPSGAAVGGPPPQGLLAWRGAETSPATRQALCKARVGSAWVSNGGPRRGVGGAHPARSLGVEELIKGVKLGEA